jgi:hypothetical protein
MEKSSDNQSVNNKVVISEILCFVKCKYGLVPNLILQTTICGFYEVDVIVDAKK